MNAFEVDAAARTIAGTRRSMGVVVEGLEMPKISNEPKPTVRSTKPSRPRPTPQPKPLPLCGYKQPKFDQSVEVVCSLGIDLKQADQQVRGSVSMPKGTGKTARVICFCGDDKVAAAKEAGTRSWWCRARGKGHGGWMTLTWPSPHLTK